MGKKKSEFLGKSLDKIYEELQKAGIRGFNVEQYDGKDIYNHMFNDKNLYSSKQGIMPESMFTNKLMSNCKDFKYNKANDLLETKDFIYLNFEYKVDDELQTAKKASNKASKIIEKAEDNIVSYEEDLKKAQEDLSELITKRETLRKKIKRESDEGIKSSKQNMLNNINDEIKEQRRTIKT